MSDLHSNNKTIARQLLTGTGWAVVFLGSVFFIFFVAAHVPDPFRKITVAAGVILLFLAGKGVAYVRKTKLPTSTKFPARLITSRFHDALAVTGIMTSVFMAFLVTVFAVSIYPYGNAPLSTLLFEWLLWLVLPIGVAFAIFSFVLNYALEVSPHGHFSGFGLFVDWILRLSEITISENGLDGIVYVRRSAICSITEEGDTEVRIHKRPWLMSPASVPAASVVTMTLPLASAVCRAAIVTSPGPELPIVAFRHV
jgi:hypothetical protein